MIATFLVQYPWLTTVALLATVLVAPLAAYALATRPGLTRLLLVSSVIAVLVITLYPESSARPAPGCAVSWSLPTLGAVELIANIVLFVPPVLLAAVLTGRPFVAALVGSALSVLIEASQAAAPVLGRACDTGDWLQNTIGAVLGALLAAIGLAVRRRISRRAASARDTTTIR